MDFKKFCPNHPKAKLIESGVVMACPIKDCFYRTSKVPVEGEGCVDWKSQQKPAGSVSLAFAASPKSQRPW